MAHPSPRRRTNPRNEGDHRHIARIRLLQEVRRVLLRAASDLADHDNAVGFRVIEEDAQTIDEVRAAEGIAADADDEGLAEPGLRGLVDGFVGECSEARDDADAAALVDEAGHDADFALALIILSVVCAISIARICLMGRLSRSLQSYLSFSNQAYKSRQIILFLSY